jgi:hypothetical protein
MVSAVPPRLGARHGEPVYRFTHKPSDRRMRNLIDEAKELADEAMAADPKKYAGTLVPAGGGAEAAAPGILDEPDAISICVEPLSERFKLGQRVLKREADGGVVLGNGTLRERPGLIMNFAKCQIGDEDNVVEALRTAWRAETPRAGAPTRGYGAPLVFGRAVAEESAATAAEGARTLSVMRNTAGERFRDVKSVAERRSKVEFEDWP